ncbi:MAG TPA: chemotaxis protein CheA, partial [Synergistaceae bacterium]|nr:chemotaxis protein CheA [Synergistaceae bacterium]
MTEREQYLKLFLDEALEVLESFHGALLKLDAAPGDLMAVGEAFRAAHTIKGMSGAMGFSNMQRLTHAAEDLLQDIRDGKVEIGEQLLGMLFVSHDLLRNALDEVARAGDDTGVAVGEVLERLHALIHSHHGGQARRRGGPKAVSLPPNEKDTLEEAAKRGLQPFRLEVALVDECPLRVVRAFMVLRLLGSLGEVFRSVPRMEDLQKDPDAVESAAGSGSFRILVFLLSSKPRELLEARVRDVVDVKDVLLEDLREKAAASPPVRLEREGASPGSKGAVVLDGAFLENALEEMLGYVLLLRERFSRMEGGDGGALEALFRGYRSLRGFSRLAGQDQIRILASAGERLVRDRLERGIPLEPEEMAALRRSLDPLEALCRHATSAQDPATEKGVAALAALLEGMHAPVPPQGVAREAPREGGGASREADHATDRGDALAAASIRVDRGKVDKLLNLAGELVSLKNAFLHVARRLGEVSPHFANELKARGVNLERLTAELQAAVMAMRMAPVETLFNRFRRVVRDLARDVGKEVDLAVEGGETELDRAVLDKLTDPLTHMVRNSMDHGLEPSQERVAGGKTPRGTVTLRAYTQGGYAFIDVRDDGRGIDPARLRVKAVERGIFSPEEAARRSDHDILEVIFLPGFSTAEKVTNLSGRGVGMDAVLSSLENVGVRITVASEVGRGSCFTLRIPLSLSSIHGLRVRIGEG